MENDTPNAQQPHGLPENKSQCPDRGEDFAQAVLAAAAKAGMSAAAAQQVQRILQPVARGEVSDGVIGMIAQALSRDEDLKNADAEGYRRGRNEKIDLLTRPMSVLDEPETQPAQFPRYARHSIWDR